MQTYLGDCGRKMSQRDLFRLLIKGLGVFFVAEGIIYGVSSVFSWVHSLFSGDTFFSGFSLPFGVVQIALGFYLFFRPNGILNLAVPLRKCQNCGYDLTGNVSGRCSECGSPVDAKQSAESPNEMAVDSNKLVKWVPIAVMIVLGGIIVLGTIYNIIVRAGFPY